MPIIDSNKFRKNQPNTPRLERWPKNTYLLNAKFEYIFVHANVAVGSCCVDLKFADPWSLAIELQLRFLLKVSHACAKSGTFSFWWISVAMKPLAKLQTRRHGGHKGAVPPIQKLCPPQARTVPRRNLQARGYWSANRGPDWCFFLDWHRISWRFWDEGLFFGDHLSSAGKSPAKSVKTFFLRRSPAFGRKNRLNFRFRPKNPIESLVFTLFILSRLG